MKIVALMSWYDERPDWLAASVASLAGHVDHIVAIDGAYALYPEGSPRSPRGQAEAIRSTATAVKMGCTIHEPNKLWGGGEIEKRSALFYFGEQVAYSQLPKEDTETPWYFVIDGDEVLSHPSDLRTKMKESREPVAAVTLWEHRDHFHPDERPFVTGKVTTLPIRCMFRALPGLHVEGNHYTYVAPGVEKPLWGDANIHECEEWLDVKLEHRNSGRDLWRQQGSKEYYKRRDSLGVETVGRV